MIYLDGIGLSFLIKEIKESVIRYKLTKIYQYDKSSFSFYFGKKNLMFQIKDNSTIFYIKNNKDLNTDFQSKFLLTLKKYLLNSILMNVRQENYDRIVYFDFEKLNQFGDIEKYTLVMEIMGKASNIFLVDQNGKILSSLYVTSLEVGNRVIINGSQYKLPFEEKKLDPTLLEEKDFPLEKEKFLMTVEGVGSILAEECNSDFNAFRNYLRNYSPTLYEFEKENKKKIVFTYNEFSNYENSAINKKKFDKITDGLNEYFETTITSNVINEKKTKILKYINQQISKNEKILKNVKIDIFKNEDFIKFKNIGDILAANMHVIKYGMEEVEVYDFYEQKEIKIKLDPFLSPKDNLASYYNKYNKGKRTKIALEKRLVEVEENLKYFENVKYFVETETDFSGIDEIEEELNLQNNNKTKIKLNRKKERDLQVVEYNDFKIYVGRNNKENDEITFKKGENSDIWLHVKDIPGSHILIVKGNKKIDQDVIYYCAKLAAKNSKAESGNKVTVDFCEKKYVKKIKGSKLGNVIYTNYNSIDVVI